MACNKPIKFVLKFYLKIHYGWEKNSSIKFIAALLVFTYVALLVAILLKQYGIIPESVAFIPENPFKAIELVFTLLLFFEVINLVFAIEKSLSKSMLIQLEILSLILLRNAFKLFGDFYNSMTWIEVNESMLYLFANAGAALLIFFGIVMIKSWDKPLPHYMDISKLKRFINVKRILSLVLIFGFSTLIVVDIVDFLVHNDTFSFFREFYTVLIFTDVLIVFISLRYSNSYFILFRNSCFALATVIIRLALSSNAPYDVLLGLIATVFVIGITLSYNKLNNLKNS